MSEHDWIDTAIGILAATFNREISTDGIKGYRIALRDLTRNELSTATKRALTESRFMPSPAELRAFAGKNRVAEIAEAWEAVRRAVDRHDYTDSVDFGPLVNAVVRNVGGWQRLCALDREALDVWARKEFERIYEAFAPKDPATLNGAPHRGALGGRPVRIAIGGKLPPAPLAEDRQSPAGQLRAVVRDLAEAKSG